MTTFAIRNLGVLQYNNGFTLWHYKLGDAPLATIAEPGYFNDAVDMFKAGDVILASGSHGATQVVAHVRNGIVSVKGMTVL